MESVPDVALEKAVMRKRKLALVLILALLALGCAPKNTSVNLKTPSQRVTVYNGILAESNRAATETAITLQRSGLLTVSQCSQVLDYTSRVANASKAVAVLQQSPGDWPVVARQIKTVLDSISPPGNFGAWVGGAKGAQLEAMLSSITETILTILKEVQP